MTRHRRQTLPPPLRRSQVPAVAVDLYNGEIDGDVAATLGSRGSPVNSAGPQVMNLRGREGGAMPELDDVASLRAASGGSSRSYVAAMQVRRLTPKECERLQGFPDDYTLIPVRGKQAADGPRYKALGNSMPVPCMAWIGRRLEMVARLTDEARAAPEK